MEDARTDEEFEDRYETLRLAIIALGIAANVALVYWQIKDTAEMIELRARARGWWDRTFTGPRRRAKELARMEAETVFEAMQAVDGGGV